jgi:hypothetical protein
MKFWQENLTERYHYDNTDVDVTITLRWILKKETERVWATFTCLRTWTSRELF